MLEQNAIGVASTARLGRLINLILPGGGLIVIGWETLGMLVTILFTASACYAIAGGLLFPDDVPLAWRNLAIGVALGTYVGAQIRFNQSLHYLRQQADDLVRRTALRQLQEALNAGRTDDAWEAIQPLIHRADTDLLIAYRLAQTLTARGDRAAALAGWRRVRRLDHHHIYKPETDHHERLLAEHQ